MIPSIDRRRQIISKHASHWPNYHHQGWSEANAHILSASRWKYSDQLVASRWQIPIECNPTETEDETRDNHTTIFCVFISFKFAFRGLPLKKKNGLCTSACDLGPGTLEMTVFFKCGMFWLWARCDYSVEWWALWSRAVSLASHEQKRSTICWAGEVYLEWAIPWVYKGSS